MQCQHRMTAESVHSEVRLVRFEFQLGCYLTSSSTCASLVEDSHVSLTRLYGN